jgi:hypothetical protein
MSIFGHLAHDTPQYFTTTDVRTPPQQAVDTSRMDFLRSLNNQYAQNMGRVNAAYADPSYGLPPDLMDQLRSELSAPASGRGPLPTYGQQLDQQQTIMNNALSRASAQGSYGSGYANQAMNRGVTDYQEGLAKTLADYRLGILERMNQAANIQDTARASLGQLMNYPGGLAAQVYGQSPAQSYRTETVPQQNSLLSQFGSSATQGLGGAFGGLLAKLFGGGGGMFGNSGGMNVFSDTALDDATQAIVNMGTNG